MAGFQPTADTEQGDPGGQNQYGWLLETGEGIEKNEREAVKWYRKAADQGLDSAQYDLGMCLLNGKGAEKNEDEAIGWFRKAAKQGYEAASRKLSELLP